MDEYGLLTSAEFFGEVDFKPLHPPVASPKKECDEQRFMAAKKRLAERVGKLKAAARSKEA